MKTLLILVWFGFDCVYFGDVIILSILVMNAI